MDTFDVTYKGQERSYSAQLLLTGYTHKIQVAVAELLILFELDEERNYRPVLDATQLEKGVKVNKNLLKEIAPVINSVVK